MKDNKVWVGLMVLCAFLLLGGALFLVGDKHKAFSRHIDFYAEFANLSGIAKGAKVRVSGMDGGQIADIRIPSDPSQRFRLELTIDDRLRGLIRSDSVASVETQGIVGDQYLLIRSGSENSPIAQPGSTIRSKEPLDLTKMLDRANGLLDQVGGTLTHVNGTITDLQGRMDGTLDSVTATVRNANGLVADVRHGKGAAGALLEDPETAEVVKQVVLNAKDATANLNTATGQVNSMLNDVQQRQLIAKVDETLENTKGASQQLNETSQQLNTTMKTALARDQYGLDAGTNLQQTLSNVNAAASNLADDTEALKHEFFFKGFFKKRGYNNLDQIPVGAYRSGELFKRLSQDRHWVAADELFQTQPDGSDILTANGRAQINDAIAHIANLYESPMIIEGYADDPNRGEQLLLSRQRAILVRTYIQVRFHLAAKQLGVVGLGTQPPTGEKALWDGICIVELSQKKTVKGVVTTNSQP